VHKQLQEKWRFLRLGTKKEIARVKNELELYFGHEIVDLGDVRGMQHAR
jgi:hypothetical protein